MHSGNPRILSNNKPSLLTQQKLNKDLCKAIRKQDYKLVQDLLDQGADCNTIDPQVPEDDHWSALCTAAETGNEEICTLLINRGANVNKGIPLMPAAAMGHEHICKLLITHKANVNAKAVIPPVPTLVFAILGCKKRICQLLLESGAGMTFHDNATALMVASMQIDPELCALFIDAECEVNAQDNGGNTALIGAAGMQQQAACEILLNHGADVSLKNSLGTSALIIATKAAALDTIRTILTHAIFNPYAKQKKIEESQKRVITALCLFKRLKLPKDIHMVILLADPGLAEDTLRCPLARFKYKSLHRMPLSVVGILISSKAITQEEALRILKRHYFECLKPLMTEALAHAEYAQVQELLNPELLDQNFGNEIEKNIIRRLELPDK